MLNEDKIKLMAGISFFEKREGKHICPANRYFMSDYISSRMLHAFFSYTFCYFLVAVIWMLYSMESLLDTASLDLVTKHVRSACVFYVIGLVGYLAIAVHVAKSRYEYARRGMKVYVAKLRRLEKRYEFQSRTKELTKEGSRHDDATTRT